MTKEEAIEWLKSLNYCDGEETQEVAQAIEMGIDTLEQQPSDDCVSRQAVLDCLTATGLKKFDFILDAREKVNNLPPVTPIQRWIPVSERLPKPNTAVLTYISTGPSETFCLAYWNDIQNYWEDWIGYKSIEKDRGYKVLAWQPLPKPYEEKRGDSDGSN